MAALVAFVSAAPAGLEPRQTREGGTPHLAETPERLVGRADAHAQRAAVEREAAAASSAAAAAAGAAPAAATAAPRPLLAPLSALIALLGRAGVMPAPLPRAELFWLLDRTQALRAESVLAGAHAAALSFDGFVRVLAAVAAFIGSRFPYALDTTTRAERWALLLCRLDTARRGAAPRFRAAASVVRAMCTNAAAVRRAFAADAATSFAPWASLVADAAATRGRWGSPIPAFRASARAAVAVPAADSAPTQPRRSRAAHSAVSLVRRC
jgi:hypothetical protein